MTASGGKVIRGRVTREIGGWWILTPWSCPSNWRKDFTTGNSKAKRKRFFG